MSNNAGSAEPVQIQAADFVSMPSLFNRWAMEAGASDLAGPTHEALKAIGRRSGASLYVLQNGQTVPIKIRKAAWIAGLEVLDAAGGQPFRISTADRDRVLASLYRAYVVDKASSDQYAQLGRFVFGLGAVGIDREEAANVLAFAAPIDMGYAPSVRALSQAPSPAQGGGIVDGLSATKTPGVVWKDSDLRELLRQYLILHRSGYKTEAAHSELATIWDMKANSIKQYLSKARALGVPGLIVQKAA